MKAVALFKGKDTYNLDIEVAIGEDGKSYLRRVKSNNYTASMSYTRWKCITNQLIVMVGDTIDFLDYDYMRTYKLIGGYVTNKVKLPQGK